MRLVLLAALFVAILLQNEVSAKSHEYKKRAIDNDEDERHLDAKEREIDIKKVDFDKDAGDLAELEDDDMMEEERDAPKKSPGFRWSWRRRCYTYYRRRIKYCH